MQRKYKIVKIRVDLLQWINEQVEKRRFWSVSHAVEVGLIKLREAKQETAVISDSQSTA